jgi:ABC-type antimicrobial peptide transport system permease subunit
VGEVETLDEVVSASIRHRRATMALFMSFGIAAIILAAVGIYGLISYSVSQRTYEIGLRIAVGATKGDVVGMIVGQALRIGVAGIAAGTAAALVFTRFLSGLLYGVGASDPVTVVAVGALLFGVTAAAGSVPAWRAARIDPTRSLRAD